MPTHWAYWDLTTLNGKILQGYRVFTLFLTSQCDQNPKRNLKHQVFFKSHEIARGPWTASPALIKEEGTGKKLTNMYYLRKNQNS